jgi:hypothetical protein
MCIHAIISIGCCTHPLAVALQVDTYKRTPWRSLGYGFASWILIKWKIINPVAFSTKFYCEDT